jgi:uncharacterized membrane protein YdfJ with MMPL/SSD domain
VDAQRVLKGGNGVKVNLGYTTALDHNWAAGMSHWMTPFLGSIPVSADRDKVLVFTSYRQPLVAMREPGWIAFLIYVVRS